MPHPNAESRLSALSILLQEVSAELRARRDPEHLYIAAIVGALGAVAWGVATIATVTDCTLIPWFRHPALVGALACVVMAFGVWVKVQREHRVYAKLRTEHVRLAAMVAIEAGIQQSELPVGLRCNATAGKGYLYSVLVIVTSVFASVFFCIAVWLSR